MKFVQSLFAQTSKLNLLSPDTVNGHIIAAEYMGNSGGFRL